jgi:hypothetical protein
MASYSVISAKELHAALERLAALAHQDGIEIRMRVTGGVVMMLAFNARAEGTRDVDVLCSSPESKLAEYAAVVAAEQGWPANWLNDSAKKFEQEAAVADDEDCVIYRRTGLVITRPSLRRMLAWKVARYADSVDKADALDLLRRILAETPYNCNDLWIQLEGHLAHGSRQRAWYNFGDAWEELHGGA